MLTSPGALESTRTRTRSGRKLQLALDLTTLEDALHALQRTSDSVDIVEVGTVLCLSEGLSAVRAIRAAHPELVLLADIRIAEAGAILSRLAFEAGADWVTVVSGASPSTFAAVAAQAADRGADVQVELSDGWTWPLVERCRALGIAHFILHRSRDAEANGILAWSERDLEAIDQIHALGGRVSVTGGLSADQLAAFAPRPVEIFIAGRAIVDAPDPSQAAARFRHAVSALGEPPDQGRPLVAQ
ncbi:MAG: orotidine 5'-phosphate decarboxylase [Bifidobacteriaceae bacterium]|jgi:3-dehydro-L-gulonate-6-phosphate decarboxylase|nr:orotidine 5'-phosphate decarboxylase [Bifidobacteriaceae bacterium]